MEKVVLHTPSGDESAEIVGVGHISDSRYNFETDTLLVQSQHHCNIPFYADEDEPGVHSQVGNAAYKITRHV